MERLALSRLSVELGDAYLAMVDEFERSGEGYPHNNIPLAREDFAAFVRELQDEEAGIGLPQGIVPQTTFVLVRNGETVLGEIRFRPGTEPPFGPGHDHLGYNVRPSERRRGYGSVMLGLVLDEARALSLPGVCLCVEGENPASSRLIERHGGRLIDELPASELGQPARVYWIDVKPE